MTKAIYILLPWLEKEDKTYNLMATFLGTVISGECEWHRNFYFKLQTKITSDQNVKYLKMFCPPCPPKEINLRHYKVKHGILSFVNSVFKLNKVSFCPHL